MSQMQEQYRLDSVGRMRKPVMTDEGFLMADAYATRAGVFIYKTAEGKVIRELRPPEEVSKRESLRTLGKKPVTDDHPYSGAIDAANSRNHIRGLVGDEVNFNNDEADDDFGFVKVTVTVTDKELIDKIATGKTQVSCGYKCDTEDTPGVWRGQEYDRIQRNIRYNHLAIVDEGRAGPDVCLRIDSNVAYQIDAKQNEETMDVEKEELKQDEEMGQEQDLLEVIKKLQERILALESKAQVDSEEMEEEEQLDESEELEEEKQDEDEDMNEVEKLKEDNAKLRAKVDAYEQDKKRADSASAKQASEQLFRNRFNERLNLLTVASGLGMDNDFREDSNDVIMRKIVEFDSPDVRIDSKENPKLYTKYRFEHILENLNKQQGEYSDGVRKVMGKQQAIKVDAKQEDRFDAKEESKKFLENNNFWTKGKE